MNRLLSAVFCALLFTSSLARAEQTIVCPERVIQQPGQVLEEDAPAGFEVLSLAGRLWLSGFSVYDGPPKDNAALKPHESTEERAVWKFETAYPLGKWISCDYGLGRIKLYQRLDDDVVECVTRAMA